MRAAPRLLLLALALAAAAGAAAAGVRDEGPPPLRVLSAGYEVRTVGTAAPAPALSFRHCFEGSETLNSTAARAAARECEPRLEETDEDTPLAVVSMYEVAVLRVRFSAPVALHRDGVRCGTANASLACEQHAVGLTRLQCGGTLVESHPSRVVASDPPLFMVPWAAHAHLPLLPLLDAGMAPRPDEFVAALVLSHSRREEGGRRRAVRLLEAARLGDCTLRFLEPSSQSWKPEAAALVRDGAGAGAAGFVGRVPLRAGEAAAACEARPAPRPAARATGPRARGALLAERAELERTLAVDGAEEAVLLQSASQVKFAGVVKGLVKGAISPVADLWGEVAGGAMADAVVDPTADQLLYPLTESVTSGVQPFLTAGVVNNIVPSLAETVTDQTIVTLCDFLSDALTRHMTPLMVSRLTQRLEPSLVKPTTAKMATDGPTKMARLVAATVTRVVTKSLPHAIVGSLTHTLTHSPQQDYYCYYCFHHKEYCSLCHNGFAPSQLYYSMYYAGYYSTYYSTYFTDDFRLGAKVVRHKEVNFEDASAFGSEE